MQDALNARLGDFNPRSPHGERRCKFIKSESITYISIHAPRTGSDVSFISLNKTNFHFNPRSPHGERHDIVKVPHCSLYISIHAPRTGSDKRIDAAFFCVTVFQSTLPARGATHSCFAFSVASSNFNPRSPHGERRATQDAIRRLNAEFQSTLPARGATEAPHNRVTSRGFQSTLPARGATASLLSLLRLLPKFQSTLPARGATSSIRSNNYGKIISIHAPRTGSDTSPMAQSR